MSQLSDFRSLREQRLYNQQIPYHHFSSPAAYLGWMGAVQAQDYEQSLLAVATRLEDHKREDIEAAIRSGSILRTWIFRGTLQFVRTEDLRWMLKLVADRVLQSLTGRLKNLELDNKTLHKCLDIIEKLPEQSVLERTELSELFKKTARVEASGIRLTHILQYASYKKLLAYGPKQGSELTHIRLSDRTDSNESREELLVRLTTLYFRSRGPASAEDYSWWSGLPLSQCRQGISAIEKQLSSRTLNGRNYYTFDEEYRKPKDKVFLLPGFDEYFLSYRDRSFIVEPEFLSRVQSLNGIFRPIIVENGIIRGTWSKTLKGKSMQLEVHPFDKSVASKDLKTALQSLSDFYGKEILLK